MISSLSVAEENKIEIINSMIQNGLNLEQIFSCRLPLAQLPAVTHPSSQVDPLPDITPLLLAAEKD